MSYTIVEGSVVRFYTAKVFTALSGVAVNPDTVTFSYKVQGQTAVTHTWTNPTGDPSLVLVNIGTGNFQADIQTLGLPGTWEWEWSGQPSSGLDTTKTSIVDVGELIVSPKAI